MKKKLLLITTLLSTSMTFSQIFSDNFDSYTSGDYLAQSNPTWDTWSGGAGTTEDVKITNVDAASAPNSIYFASTAANGGPTDVILRFDQVYTSGNFTLESDFLVETGKGAYFNLQQNHNVGEVWAIDCYMLNNGTLRFKSGANVMLDATYPTGQWYNLRMEIDLTSNIWEVFVDNVSVGTFSNPVNSIGIWDLYPVNPAAEGGNGQSGFYVDNVSYNQTPPSLPQLNAGVTFVNSLEGLAGQNATVTAKIRNLGVDAITSFDLTYTYAGGTPVTENITSVNIASLNFYEFSFATETILQAGTNNLEVTVSNVNGAGPDMDGTDDTKTITSSPVTPATGKVVVIEEGTGTWCQWCPRGHVFMEDLSEKYDQFYAGIAVHNGDPMTDAVYDAGIATLISGYPSALVDRGTAIDPSEIEPDFLNRIVIDPKAIITNGATFDPSTRELKVSLTYTFDNAASGNWKVACVLTEDGITGTGSGYSQVNAYAGGGSGVMGGFEALPNPVPASQMVYNHVARSIAPSFNGVANKLPTSINVGEIYTVCFTFTLPATWDENNMHIIGMLIDPTNKINNGSYTTVTDAVTNGLATCTSTADVEAIEFDGPNFKLHPNPTNGMTYVHVNGVQGQDLQLIITDLTGKVVAKRAYQIAKDVQLPINTNAFESGTYIVQIHQNGKVEQHKLVVQ